MITRLRHFLQDWIYSLSQYPGAYLIALYTTLIWILLFIYDNSGDNKFLEILTTCGIVFPLMITGALVSQIHGQNNKKKRINQIVAFVIGIGFYLYIHSLDIFNDNSSVDSDAIFIGLSYVIAWFSILGGIVRSTNTKTILTRGWIKEFLLNVLIAIVSSLILRGGVSASIGSVDYLFDINLYYKRYQYIGVVSFCIIGVSILLTNLSTTKKVDNYPALFRFFGLYIFLPLAVIYACILLSYGTKILFTQIWPKGLISWMVIGYTIRCTIVYFLTYPLENQSWIKKIHTGYFVSILCFLPLLFGAIWQRIAQYGITEERYLIVMIAIWISIVGIGGLIWRQKLWLLMIGGLLILAFSSAYTPRSANSVSLRSQQSRLEKLLIQYNLYDGDNIIKRDISLSSLNTQDYKSMQQIESIASYISQSHGAQALAYLYKGQQKEFQKIENINKRDIGKSFVENIGYTGTIDERTRGDMQPSESYFTISYNKDIAHGPIDIQSYKNLWYINSYQDIVSNTGAYSISLRGKNKEKIIIQKKDQKEMSINLYDHVRQLYKASLETDTKPIINFDGGFVLVDNLQGNIIINTDTYTITSYDLTLFVK